ncbi:sugar kinase [Anaerosacchariphilus sp. NSJ-68]|uniref:Sugar kinase n=2 Tax=Lachnospiraceae TaxID=186803 RepID=A0A923LDE3_9FIRM|nr:MULTISPECIES: sugar kinase [Lachnospiraceae]MBC5660484.1 sugar kinase [Anaerosacchariphilus hominis]MBC5699347.1 sugar kinase [Roseburia difficilis]
MGYDIVTMGPLLCEIMRKELDKPLDRPADFTGPYPSGDTAIMLNAAARLGARCAMIGVVGDDGFGRCVTDRLKENGVDCSMIRVHPEAATGTAFVCYYSDGSRNFLFHVHHAAPGMLEPEDVKPEKLAGSKWLHVSGFTMSVNQASAEAIYKMVETASPESKVCFDPNIRPEALSEEEIRKLCMPVIRRADIIFPSKSEAAMLTGCATDEEGCRSWAADGKIVVLKNGDQGCRIYSGTEAFDVPGFSVEEVDPTGAGDTFCGAFLTGLTEGMSLEDCGRFANAAGAMSVRKQGPMEGAPSRAELEAFLQEQTNT